MKQVSRSRNAFNVQEMTRMVRNKNWGLKTCFAIKQKVTTNIKKRKKLPRPYFSFFTCNACHLRLLISFRFIIPIHQRKAAPTIK